MESHVLPRSGDAPLRFAGELLAESDGRWHADREQNRYHTLAVYRTASGNYAASVSYQTRWQGETGRDCAHVAATPAELTAWLRSYDPCAHVVGFPPGDAFAEKQRRLLADIRARHVSQVLAVLADPVFHEEADTIMAAKAFRFSEEAEAALSRLQSTHGYETQVGAVTSALVGWDRALSEASCEIAGVFSRTEWNAIADACNGTLWEETIRGSSPAAFVAAEIEDAHRLNGLGEKWFVEGDTAVAELVRKIRGLTYAQAWALLRAVCWFWQHTETDHQKDEWWAIAFRRKHAGGQR